MTGRMTDEEGEDDNDRIPLMRNEDNENLMMVMMMTMSVEWSDVKCDTRGNLCC